MSNQDNQNRIRALLEHELRRSDIICEAADNIQDIETHLEQKFIQYLQENWVMVHTY